MNNQEKIEKLKQAIALIFEVEESYQLTSNVHDARHDGYRIRIKLADLIEKIKHEEFLNAV